MGGRQILDLAGAIDSLGVPVSARGQDTVLFKLRGNLLRSDPFQRHAVNPPHDLRRFLVHDPAFGVLRVFDVPVRRLPHGFAGIAFDLVADAPLLADVARISLDYIFGRTDDPHGMIYNNCVKLGLNNPEMARFVEMCFDPGSAMNERLKAMLVQMLSEVDAK